VEDGKIYRGKRVRIYNGAISQAGDTGTVVGEKPGMWTVKLDKYATPMDFWPNELLPIWFSEAGEKPMFRPIAR
jgi:hypothetical protein